MENIIVVSSKGVLKFNNLEYRCALGRGGARKDKQEGDGATPIGTFPLRGLFYRSDRFDSVPQTGLSITPLAPDDGWCDDVKLPEYNQQIKLPYAGSHERLWREDDIYDLIVVVGYNDQPAIVGRGSAIFMHIARPAYTPTDGCIALSRQDLLDLLSQITSNTQIEITD